MDYKEFVVELSKLINNQNPDNQINENIFGLDDRFNRGKILFDQITLLGKILNVFKFKNQIISIDNKFYIKVDGINLQIVSPYFLKGVGEEVHATAKKICDVLDHFKKSPKIIIDVGSCWGETSLYFAKRYVGSTVFSIEGSIDNFVIQLENKIKQDFKTENLYIDNLVISNKNGSGRLYQINSPRSPITESTTARVGGVQPIPPILTLNQNQNKMRKKNSHGQKILLSVKTEHRETRTETDPYLSSILGKCFF